LATQSLSIIHQSGNGAFAATSGKHFADLHSLLDLNVHKIFSGLFLDSLHGRQSSLTPQQGVVRSSMDFLTAAFLGFAPRAGLSVLLNSFKYELFLWP